MGVDPDFGLDAFGNPKVLNESQTLINNILMLLFMKQGAYPSLPKMGIEIQRYLYEFFDEIDTEDIKARIASQCSEFVPEVQSGELDVIKTVYYGQPCLLVTMPIRVDDELTGLIIGISLDSIGSLIYNSKLDKSILG